MSCVQELKATQDKFPEKAISVEPTEIDVYKTKNGLMIPFSDQNEGSPLKKLFLADGRMLFVLYILMKKFIHFGIRRS